MAVFPLPKARAAPGSPEIGGAGLASNRDRRGRDSPSAIDGDCFLQHLEGSRIRLECDDLAGMPRQKHGPHPVIRPDANDAVNEIPISLSASRVRKAKPRALRPRLRDGHCDEVYFAAGRSRAVTSFAVRSP